jgi:hypothetical protein
MVKIMMDAVLVPSMWAFASGIMFAGSLANLGNLNRSGASRALPSIEEESDDQAPMWPIPVRSDETG